MVVNLRQSKARLSELVEAASQGEEVLITVRGRPKARLTAAASRLRTAERAAWLKELRWLQRTYSFSKNKTTVEAILSELRADRV